MKNLRKVFSMLVAVVMGLSLAVPAFAGEEDGTPVQPSTPDPDYTLTINAKDTGNHTYTAYQFFAGTLFEDETTETDTLSDVQWGSGFNTTDDFYKALWKVLDSKLSADEKKMISDSINANGEITNQNNFKKAKDYFTARKVSEIIATVGEDANFLDSLAKMAFTFKKGEGKSSGDATKSTDENGKDINVYTIPGLAAGYYLIQETTPNLSDSDNMAASRHMVSIVKSTTITAKSEYPELHKKIRDEEGEKSLTDTNKKGLGVYYQASDKTLGDHNVAAIGETVHYELFSKVPDMTGYDNYTFKVNDTLSKGLTLNKDSFSVTILDGNDNSKNVVLKKTPAEENEKKTFTVSEITVDTTNGNQTFTINLNNFLQYANLAGKVIKINYNVVVNENAIIGNTGNPNTANLQYSNNPNSSGDGTGSLGKTPDETVRTYLTEVKLYKFDGDAKKEDGTLLRTPLKGAEFKVTVDSSNNSYGKVPTFISGEKFVEAKEDATDVYYKLKDGTYTKTAPTEENSTKYENTTKYELTKFGTLVGIDSVKNENGTVTYKSDETGNVVIAGLPGGTFEIEETKAPDGFNKLDGKIKLVVSWEMDSNNAEQIIWKYSYNGGAEQKDPTEGTISFDVENHKGATLPSTGGMGTTMFVAGGVALMAVAGVLLVVKKRTAAED